MDILLKVVGAQAMDQIAGYWYHSFSFRSDGIEEARFMIVLHTSPMKEAIFHHLWLFPQQILSHPNPAVLRMRLHHRIPGGMKIAYGGTAYTREAPARELPDQPAELCGRRPSPMNSQKLYSRCALSSIQRLSSQSAF